MTGRTYTTAERRQRAALLVRGSRQAAAGTRVDARIERALDRIDQAAEDRYRREQAAALRLVEQARDAVAAAKAAERAASRQERPAARTARKQAEQALKRAEQAAATYQ